MAKRNKAKLLEDPEIINEINRHLWLESEKHGYDIGFDRAAQDWLDNYADEWLDYHKPAAKKKAARKKATTKKKAVTKKKTTAKKKTATKRSAKSYL